MRQPPFALKLRNSPKGVKMVNVVLGWLSGACVYHPRHHEFVTENQWIS